MVEELLKAIPVFLLSMLKFILGPISGFGAKLHFVTTLIVTIGGMMTSVFGFTYFGDWIREHILNWIKKVLHNFRMWLRTKVFKSKKKPTKKRSAFWSKYGLAGVACFTPIILTPIGGTLLALSMGHDKRKIIIYMLISAVVWGLIFCSLIYFVGEKVLPDFVK